MATEAGQTIKVTLTPSQVRVIRNHLEEVDELTEQSPDRKVRASVRGEVEFVVETMIDNLARTGGWWGSIRSES